jgi:hypothetical protein
MATATTHSVADAILIAATDSSGAATKTVSMPIGVPGYTLHDEQRTVPATEPPVLPVNKDLDYIGKSPERWDGHAKVTGRARYTADVQLPGMLYARFVNASIPHARVLSIDTSAAERESQSVAVTRLQLEESRSWSRGSRFFQKEFSAAFDHSTEVYEALPVMAKILLAAVSFPS